MESVLVLTVLLVVGNNVLVNSSVVVIKRNVDRSVVELDLEPRVDSLVERNPVDVGLCVDRSVVELDLAPRVL